MAVKEFRLDTIGAVKCYKRKGASGIRISVSSRGGVRVSQPYWLPYAAGLDYARQQQDWISQQLAKQETPVVMQHGQRIGASHQLLFLPKLEASKATSRVTASLIKVSYPLGQSTSNASVQAVAEKACLRALKQQAEASLPARLAALASEYNFSYRSVRVKRLTSRWGSCDSHKNIILNIYLMQLPDKLVDYVLLHELTHTEVLRHGQPFWQAMAKLLPNVKALRREIKQHQTAINPKS
jgi:predicted metal-dependent hydrolase